MSIEAEVKKDFGSFSLDISFIEDNKRIGILGASGGGKSMTLKMLAGIETPDSGRIVLNGRVLYDSSLKINVRPQQRRVGYLFQNYALFPTMTVFRNIEAGLGKMNKKEKRQKAEEIMHKFCLDGLGQRYPFELSGGQQQRVALARIMVYEPDLILLDEPFSALDVYLKDRMQEELMELLSDYGGSVILVSHSRDEIYRFSDRLLIIHQGRITNHGNTEDIFRDPGTRSAAMLTGCKNFSSVAVLDEHTLEAKDWGITLKVKGRIPADTAFIGYRAHEFLPVWGEREENCIRFELSSSAKLQFEKNFYIRPEREVYDRDSVITWFVQREGWEELNKKGLPSYLKFKEEEILYLK